MANKPVIYVSAVTKELGSAREAVAQALRMLDCEPVFQEEFGDPAGVTQDILDAHLAPCAAVLQLVGHQYGWDIHGAPYPAQCMGHTHYEARYARLHKRPIWYLVTTGSFAPDHPNDEDAEKKVLQTAYRIKVRQADHLHYAVADLRDVELTVFRMLRQFDALRREDQRWFEQESSSGGGGRAPASATSTRAERESMIRGLLAEFVLALQQVRHTSDRAVGSRQEEDLYARLGVMLGMDAENARYQIEGPANRQTVNLAVSPLERAHAAYILKDYGKAEPLALEAAGEALEAVPPRTPEAIAAYELAGQTARELTHHAAALHHLREAEALTDRQRAPVEWARVQFTLARALFDQGQHRDAGEIFEKVAQEQTTALGANHPATLRSRLWAAMTLDRQGRSLIAEHELRQVIELETQLQGLDYKDTLKARHYLADALLSQGKYPEAVLEERAVLAIKERVFGPEHPDTLASRTSLASALDLQGKHIEAEQEHRTVRAIQERVLGPEHPSTLMNRAGLANTLYAQGRIAEAEKEYRATMSVQARVLDPEHPNTLQSRVSLANALYSQGKHVQAEQEYRAVLAIQERALGPEHPDTLASRMKLAHALNSQGNSAEAEREHRAVLAIQMSVLGPAHPDTLACRMSLAHALYSQDRSAEAELEHRRVLTIQERILGPEHHKVFFNCYHLAMALRKQSKYAEALTFAQRAEEGWTKLLGASHGASQDAKLLREVLETELRRD